MTERSDETKAFYQQVYGALESLKRGECFNCKKRVEFVQKAEDVYGSCGCKLYKGTVNAFKKAEPEKPGEGLGGCFDLAMVRASLQRTHWQGRHASALIIGRRALR
jgi:hypothetical protein